MEQALSPRGPVEWAPGHRFRGYQIIREIGRGGMAVVYLARRLDPQSSGILVAIKRVLPHLASEQRFVELFLNEARLSSKLTHPNTLRVIDFGTMNGEHFMVLEYVHGVDLRELLRDCARSSTPLPLACGLYIVGAVARGLHDAHVMRGPDGIPLGLIHRDVTPSNVLVGYDGSVRLGDFGVAKALALSQTRSMSLKGKVAYMSPEQCSGGPIDRRTDVFSLGVMAWEVSTGRRLFRGNNEFHIMNQVVSGDVRRPTEEDPDYPPALEAIVLEALLTDPDHRYQTAQEMVNALDQFVRDQQLDASADALRCFLSELYGEQELRMATIPAAASPSIDEFQTTAVDAVELEPTRLPATTSRPSSSGWPRRLAFGGFAVGLATGLAFIGLASSSSDHERTSSDEPAALVPNPEPPVNQESLPTPPPAQGAGSIGARGARARRTTDGARDLRALPAPHRSRASRGAEIEGLQAYANRSGSLHQEQAPRRRQADRARSQLDICARVDDANATTQPRARRGACLGWSGGTREQRQGPRAGPSAA